MKKKRTKASSVGVIGGKDGPTAIFSVSKREWERSKAEQEAFLERAKKLAVPHVKSFDETVRYLCETYGARPCGLSKGQRQSAKVNIILNMHPDLVGWEPFPEDPTEEQLIEYREKQDSWLEQAFGYPEEKLGLMIEGYRIPEDTANILRERDQKESVPGRKGFWSRVVGGWAGWWTGRRGSQKKEPQQLTVVLERTHQYLVADGAGGGALCDDLARFQGVSEKDIREKSPRFVAYAYLMKKDGLWK